MRTKDLMPTIYKEIDEKTASLDPESYVCRRGCHSCCSMVVSASPVEVFHVANLLRQYGKHHKEYRQGCRRYAELYRRLLPGEFARERPVACPFLRSGQCGIYQHRPTACRCLYVSGTTDNCQRLATESMTVLGVYDLTRKLHQTLAGMFPDRDCRPVVFVPAVALAIDDTKLFHMWAAGAAVFFGLQTEGGR
jgi:Fe-S-cluster containining protein